MSIKVVYNACYGGFSLSDKAAKRLVELGVVEAAKALDEKKKSPVPNLYAIGLNNIPRHDPRLVQVVEELGAEASGSYANLEVAKIQGNQYRIDEYDGFESVQEPSDIEWITVQV